MHQPARQHARHIGCKALAGDAPDPCTDGLYCRHQRIGQRNRPHQVEAKLSADLRMGGDATRIVIGRASDEPWTQTTEP